MCAILGIWDHANAKFLLRDGLALMGNRGRDVTAIETYHETNLGYRGLGTAYQVFEIGSEDFEKLYGSMGIGHARYATTGERGSPSDMLAHSQPVSVNDPCYIAMAANGDIPEKQQTEMRNFLTEKGRVFNTESDTEVTLNYFAWILKDRLMSDEHLEKTVTNNDIFYSLQKTIEAFPTAAFSTVGMIVDRGERRMFAFTDKYRVRPAVLAKKETGKKTAYMVASERSVPSALDFEYVDEIYGGQGLIFGRDGLETRDLVESDSMHCMFDWTYFSRPSNIMMGKGVHAVREELGKMLGLWEIKYGLGIRDDIISDNVVVIPVMDGGSDYTNAFCDITGYSRKEGIDKSHIGRNFQKSKDQRKHGAKIKHIVLSDVVKGMNVVIIDDSLVRGDTTKSINEALRYHGAEEIHVRLGTPPLKHPCELGIDMKTEDQFIARGRTEEEIAKEIYADSVHYTTKLELKRAIGLDLCMGCLDGTSYPRENIARQVAKVGS